MQQGSRKRRVGLAGERGGEGGKAKGDGRDIHGHRGGM